MAKKTVKGKARKGSVAKALVRAVKAAATPPKKAAKGTKFVCTSSAPARLTAIAR